MTGTILGLFVHASGAPGGSATVTATLMVDNVAKTNYQVTFGSAEVDKDDTSTEGEAVTEGTRVSLRLEPSSNAVAVRYTWALAIKPS